MLIGGGDRAEGTFLQSNRGLTSRARPVRASPRCEGSRALSALGFGFIRLAGFRYPIGPQADCSTLREAATTHKAHTYTRAHAKKDSAHIANGRSLFEIRV